jgi:hypothetical protein
LPMTPFMATAEMVLMRMEWGLGRTTRRAISFNYTLTAALMWGCGS